MRNMKRSGDPPRNHFSVDRGAPLRPSQAPVLHDKLPHLRAGSQLWTGAVALHIHILEPVHIGSGQLVPGPGKEVVKDIVRSRGVPVIPGSSLKGACRQIYELFTASPQAPGKKEKGKPPRERIEIFRKRQPKGTRQLLTSAASLFGCLGYQGRISFDDARPGDLIEVGVAKLSVPHQPHGQPNAYRFYGDLSREALIAQEQVLRCLTIPKGCLFETRLRLRNVSEPELGGILLSLGIGQFAPRIGGGKYDGLGRVKFEVASFRLHQGLRGQRLLSSESSEAGSVASAWINGFDLDERGAKALEVLSKRLSFP